MNEGCEETRAGPTSRPTFHVHPLQRCNLSCLHCYSESSPSATAQLSLAQLELAVRCASGWGYQVLAISGGEPLLYPWLRELLELGHYHGMTTTVVTNGLLLDRPGAISAMRCADAVAVSVDGLADTHDRLRGRRRAFDKTLTALGRLHAEGIPFAISCGVTPYNIGELDELALAVLQAGASALQLHPVELAGRAKHDAGEMVLDEEGASAFFVLAHLLREEYAGRLAIAVDAAHRVTVLANPRMLYAQSPPVMAGAQRLADNVGVLVLDPYGNLMPVTYGFGAEHWLGTVDDDLSRIAQEYLGTGGGVHKLYALGKRTFEMIRLGQSPDVFNPSDLLARASHSLVNGWRTEARP